MVSGMRITVCIPTVRTTALEYAVRSVRRQTFQDWELVVVGQGDETPLRDATARAADGDVRIRYLHLNRWGLSAGAQCRTGRQYRRDRRVHG